MQGASTNTNRSTRWNPAWVERRLRLEADRESLIGGAPLKDGVHLPVHYRAFRLMLKTLRLYGRGYRNYTDIRVNRIPQYIEGWPPPLDGLRLLQLSDLHIDLDAALLPAIKRVLQDLEFDLVVMTGDFLESARSGHEKAQEDLKILLNELGNPPFGSYAVLGNHDSLDIAECLESLGTQVLVNEAVPLGDGSAAFALAGIEDAYYFGLDDIPKAARLCPPGLPRILLSHSPQVAPEARAAGFSLVLSGHTHGGQICLPGGHSLITMEQIPRPLFRGPWKQGPLSGYTSTGTGACHLPIRFNCPPEVVIHSIHAAGRLT